MVWFFRCNYQGLPGFKVVTQLVPSMGGESSFGGTLDEFSEGFYNLRGALMATLDQIRMVANSLSFKRLKIPYAKRNRTVDISANRSFYAENGGNTTLDRRHTVLVNYDGDLQRCLMKLPNMAPKISHLEDACNWNSYVADQDED